jgi:hypothetical protein
MMNDEQEVAVRAGFRAGPLPFHSTFKIHHAKLIIALNSPPAARR